MSNESFAGFIDSGNLQHKTLIPRLYQGQQMQIVLLPHDHPIAVIDLNDFDVREELDLFAGRRGLTRDEAVLQIVTGHLANERAARTQGNL